MLVLLVVLSSDLSMSSMFGLRSSYMLEYHWLLALLLRSARCFTTVEGQCTPLRHISPPSSRLLLSFFIHSSFHPLLFYSFFLPSFIYSFVLIFVKIPSYLASNLSLFLLPSFPFLFPFSLLPPFLFFPQVRQ